VRITVVLGLVATTSAGQDLAVQGKLMCVNGGKLHLWDLETKEGTQIVSAGEILGGFGSVEDASFSPDGKRVCLVISDGPNPPVYRIYTTDNDGGNPEHICDFTNHDGQAATWCTDGYIYWCENTNAIYRVNVATKQKETYWDEPDIKGYDFAEYGPKIQDMIVSNDGRLASARGGGSVSVFNLEEKYLLNYGKGGCSGWISPNGDRVAHPYTCCVPFPDGASSHNTVVAVENIPDTRDSTLIRPVEIFLWPPGQPHGATTARAGWFRWAKNDNNYTAGRAMGDSSALGAIVYDVRTGEWMNVPMSDYKVCSMWMGTLPSPTDTGPKIAVTPTSVLLSSASLTANVGVANTGSGILGTLDITESAAWLEVAVSGSGNDQTLAFTATVGSLDDGTYRTTVTVSGGGAENAANVAVTFNVGVYLTAPRGVTAAADTSDNVLVRWTDESTQETGFAIERSTDDSAFDEVGRVAADVTSYTDTLPGVGTHRYRVRAFDASSYSSYSDTGQATIATAGSITITNPLGGETFTAGQEVHVTWTAENIGAVKLQYTTDGGDTWSSVTSGAGIFTTDDEWGDYTWVVPQVSTEQALILISDYNEGPASSLSGLFTITPNTATVRTALDRRTPGLWHMGGTALRFAVGLNPGDTRPGRLVVTTLDGRTVFAASVQPGTSVVDVDGADLDGVCIVTLSQGGKALARHRVVTAR